MDLGDVLDGAFRLLIRNWRTYLLACGLLLLPGSIASAYQQSLSGTAGGGFGAFFTQDALIGGPPPLPGPALAAAVALSVLVSVLVTPLVYGVAARIAATAYEGGTPAVWESLRAAAGRYWALVGAILLLFLLPAATFVPGLIVVVVGVVSETIAAVVLGGILLFAAVLAAIALVTLFTFVWPVVVVERTGAWTGLTRSASLVRPHFWRVLGIMLVTYLIVGMVAVALGVPVGIATVFTGPTVTLLTTALVGILGGVLTTPLLVNALTLLYYDSRIRHEGYDLELRAGQMASGGELGGGAG